MTKMTGPDYAVACNLINTHTHTDRKADTDTHGYVCIVIPYSKSKGQPGEVANPPHGQLNIEN